MQLKSAGIDLSGVIAALCRHFKIAEKELGSTSKRPEIARARSLVSYIATREFALCGSEVACRLKVDRSTTSRAAQRVANDPALTSAAVTLLKLLQP
jgi:chromosomal replication initiation ATPase DnaA